jgi:SWIM zinc finger
MSVTWTQEKILALAPDASSAKNGKALAVQHKWSSLSYNQQAIWGECQGSGKTPYQTRIDLTEPAFKCTCPSRKLPCKHALGLFLIFVTEKAAFTESPAPVWVSEWLNARQEKTKKTETTPKPVDTIAQSKRAEQRYSKVVAGMQDLELWLKDVVSQGLVAAQVQPYSFWDNVAARLIDAQAPGVARLVRQMGSIAYSGLGWQDRLLGQLGRVYLLLEGFKRLDTLPTDVQADIGTQIGWTQSQEELLTKLGVRDNWLILGQRVEEEEKLRSLRTWLWGEKTQQAALILNFAYGSQPLDVTLIPGTTIDAELVFFQSAYPLRAIVKTRYTEPSHMDLMPGYAGVSQMMQAYAKALSSNPWIEQFPVSLLSVIPICNQDGSVCNLRDVDGYLLPMGDPSRQVWQLLAESGGHSIDVFGEWNGDRFLALSVWGDNNLVLL